jgi:hypothetical protein
MRLLNTTLKRDYFDRYPNDMNHSDLLRNRKNLAVSASGGETSLYMAYLLWKYMQDEYNMVFVFANTGMELRETVHFIFRCSEHFGFPVHYIEADINPQKGNGGTFKELSRHDLSYIGEKRTPFEDMAAKFGLPNPAHKNCTRDLKEVPIRKFAQAYFGGEPFYTAIGIRMDEIDRMSVRRQELSIIYPLIKTFLPQRKMSMLFGANNLSGSNSKATRATVFFAGKNRRGNSPCSRGSGRIRLF